MTDARYSEPGCECGDAFCAGCENAEVDRDGDICDDCGGVNCIDHDGEGIPFDDVDFESDFDPSEYAADFTIHA